MVQSTRWSDLCRTTSYRGISSAGRTEQHDQNQELNKNTVNLLNAIWTNASGKRVILYKKAGQKKGGRNEFFDDNDSAWSWLLKKNGEGYEVWFAMALFDASGNRTKQAAKSVRSFWLD